MSLASAAGLVAAVAAFVILLFAAINSGIRRQIARRMAVLDTEGIIQDSGWCRATARYRRYRARGMYASRAIRVGPARVVLTRAHLVMLGVRAAEPVPLAELHRYRIAAEAGRLVIASDDPVGASGSIEVRFRLADPDAYLAALRDRKNASGSERGMNPEG